MNYEVEDLLEDIYKYAQYFFIITYGCSPDDDLNNALSGINSNVVRPFLLCVYDDYEQGIIDKAQLIEVIELLESYLVRRDIVGLASNTLSNVFAVFYDNVDKEDYVNSVKQAFLKLQANKRFPEDLEVKQGLKVKDIYNSKIRKHLLKKLENYNSKEVVSIDNCTIEHILPQNRNLSQEWRDDLGLNWVEIHEKYVHTLGNLTLTMYNSNLSDKPFVEKRDMKGGFRDSRLQLNKSLCDLDVWNEDAIHKRSEELTDIFFKVWPYPVV